MYMKGALGNHHRLIETHERFVSILSLRHNVFHRGPELLRGVSKALPPG
jgi:hypothetical protein